MLEHLIEPLFCLDDVLHRAGTVRPPSNKTAEPSYDYSAAKRIGTTSVPKARA